MQGSRTVPDASGHFRPFSDGAYVVTCAFLRHCTWRYGRSETHLRTPLPLVLPIGRSLGRAMSLMRRQEHSKVVLLTAREGL